MQPDDQNQTHAVTDSTQQDRSARWLEENREAIKSYNRRLGNAPAFGDVEKLF